MKQADVAVIGGGILGCFAARSLMRWKLSVILLEKEPDVCTGITRANSAIVYAGYDNRPGSRKAAMTVAGNRNFDTLCRELDVPFSRCGSLMVTYDEKSLPRLRQKLENGLANGVPGLQMLSEGQVRQMEPALPPGVAGALYAPSTGTVNPWSLGIAAFENGVRNGVVPMLSTGVTHIKSRAEGYVLQTNRGDIACKAVINCAGLYADQVQEMLFPPDVRLHWDGADYLVLDRSAAKPGHIIFGGDLREGDHIDPLCGGKSAAQRYAQTCGSALCHHRRRAGCAESPGQSTAAGTVRGADHTLLWSNAPQSLWQWRRKPA